MIFSYFIPYILYKLWILRVVHEISMKFIHLGGTRTEANSHCIDLNIR